MYRETISKLEYWVNYFGAGLFILITIGTAAASLRYIIVDAQNYRCAYHTASLVLKTFAFQLPLCQDLLNAVMLRAVVFDVAQARGALQMCCVVLCSVFANLAP